jgi:hypothetical protein
MQRTHFCRTFDALNRPETVEADVINNVPQHGGGGQNNGQPTHFHHGTLHKPRRGRGEDRRRNPFKTDSMKDPLRQFTLECILMLHSDRPR